MIAGMGVAGMKRPQVRRSGRGRVDGKSVPGKAEMIDSAGFRTLGWERGPRRRGCEAGGPSPQPSPASGRGSPTRALEREPPQREQRGCGQEAAARVARPERCACLPRRRPSAAWSRRGSVAPTPRLGAPTTLGPRTTGRLHRGPDLLPARERLATAAGRASFRHSSAWPQRRGKLPSAIPAPGRSGGASFLPPFQHLAAISGASFPSATPAPGRTGGASFPSTTQAPGRSNGTSFPSATQAPGHTGGASFLPLLGAWPQQRDKLSFRHASAWPHRRGKLPSATQAPGRISGANFPSAQAPGRINGTGFPLARQLP